MGITRGTIRWSCEQTLIVFIWKAYFLYAKGFKVSVWNYWKIWLIYFLVIIFSAGIVDFIVDYIDEGASWINWLSYATIVTVTYFVVCYILLLTCTQGMKDFTKRFCWKRVKNRI